MSRATYCVLAVLLLFVRDAPAAESLRAQSLAVLNAAVSGHAGQASIAQVSDLPANHTLGVGKPLELKLTLPRAAYVSVIYLDSHGVLEVTQPNLGSAGNFATPGEHYVPDASEAPWSTRPPVGPATICVVASEKPVSALVSPQDATARHFLISAADAPAFLAKVGREISGSKGMLAERLDLTIELSSAEYSASDIVRYFNETTRSVSKPRLDVYINFALNSADIQPSSLKALDTWGRVLKDPLMAGRTFIVGGHTDDLGTTEYNQQLSVRRADAVRAYLTTKYGIAPERLQVHGYGMTQPLVEGHDEAARTQNRRVDFERSDPPR